MNPGIDDNKSIDSSESFDRDMRKLHAEAVTHVSPQTLARLRAARHGLETAPQRGHAWRWVAATAFSAVLAVAIGALAVEGKKFHYRSNERLQKALELKLFEDQKDTIKLSSLVSGVVDKDTQEKIDIVKSRMMKSYGYCQTCSADVLSFVASIFARGSSKD
jgi:hypothetical protein